MLIFDITHSPPTRQEIETERTGLKRQKKLLIKKSITLDFFHGLLLFICYWQEMITGYSLAAILITGTISVPLLSTGLINADRFQLSVYLTTFAMMFSIVTAVCCRIFLQLSVSGSVVTFMLVFSIIFFSSQVGIKLLKNLNASEDLNNILEIAGGQEEINRFCHAHPELEEYRQQASQILACRAA